jgi:CRISPR-associated endonuclease/helicase Cas3
MCGILHDLGKYRTEFQEYLFGKRNRSKDTQHAIYGAGYALFDLQSPEVALCVAGHHAGLHNAEMLAEDIRKIHSDIRPILDACSLDGVLIPQEPQIEQNSDRLMAEFEIRMLFSCLVQADWHDTAIYSGKELLPPKELEPDFLLQKLKSHITNLSSIQSTSLQQIRSSIFEACLEAGKLNQGIYSLTVPTGGGKTLSMMAFALQHAITHGLNRVIVVIPYLSIIEQNAQVYRNLFGSDVVIEHHSSVKQEDQELDEEYSIEIELEKRWFVEAWDAPIIVTTSVQFIESLFNCKPGRCRKLRNIANSVILFDEAQLFPSHLLEPLLDVLKRLVDEYGCSLLFSSATQPSLTAKSLASAFPVNSIREIVANPVSIYTNLRRVNYHKELLEEALNWDQLVEHFRSHTTNQILAVTNLRKHAFALFESLKDTLSADQSDSIFHLSSAMCAEHRSNVLGQKNSPVHEFRCLHILY